MSPFRALNTTGTRRSWMRRLRAVGVPAPDWAYLGGACLLLVASAGIVAYFALYFLSGNASQWEAAVGWLAPVWLFIFLGYFWTWASNTDGLDGRYVLRTSGWFLLFLCLSGALYHLTVLHQVLHGTRVTTDPFLLANWATGGGCMGLLIGMYDAQRRYRHQRAQSRLEQIERRNEHITVLNRILRHDIRSNVNAITGRADLLAREAETDDHLEEIERHATEIVELADEARDIQRLVRDETTLAELDLATLLRERIDHAERAYPDAHITADVPETVQVCAHELLHSALDNVLENAIEHNDKDYPHVDIEVRTWSEAGGDGTVEVHVDDDGPGLPEHERRTFRAGTETPLQHSSGLGLWLVQWVVRTSGGEVTIADRAPEGTTVTLRLPVAGTKRVEG